MEKLGRNEGEAGWVVGVTGLVLLWKRKKKRGGGQEQEREMTLGWGNGVGCAWGRDRWSLVIGKNNHRRLVCWNKIN